MDTKQEEPQPFCRTDVAQLHSLRETVKVSVLFVLLGLPRLAIILGTMVFYALMCRISALLCWCPIDDIQRHALGRRVFRLGRYLARALLLATGMVVSVKGTPAPGVRVFVANHVSMLDIVVMWGYSGDAVPGFVSKIDMLRYPLLGALLRASRGVVVCRSTPGEGTSKQIIQHVCDPTEPPMVIYPEGTTTNGTALLRFHRGAFLPQKPVQPVALRFPFKHFSPAYDILDAPEYLWRLLGQLYNRVEVEFLPLHTPSEAEMRDPDIFARNVRAELAAALNIPATEKTFADKLAYMHADTRKYD